MTAFDNTTHRNEWKYYVFVNCNTNEKDMQRTIRETTYVKQSRNQDLVERTSNHSQQSEVKIKNY